MQSFVALTIFWRRYNDMNKIDLINPQNPKSLDYQSPEISEMFPLQVDDRTTFYFRTEEKRKAFIRKRLNKR